MLTVAGLGRPRTTTRAVVAAFAVVLAISTSVAWARGARADSSATLVSLTNGARASAGLPGLVVSADLAAAAREQAARMAAAQTLEHTPNLPQAVCCWQSLGENVGYGGSPGAIQAAFMASPVHRANILNVAYTQVGVGSVVDAHGVLWVSAIFRRPSGQAPAQAATPSAAPSPAPTHRARSSRSPAIATPAPATTHASPPRSVAGGLIANGPASRGLDDGRLPLSAAQQLAEQLSALSKVVAPDPVSRLISFVDAAVEAAP